MQNLVLVRQHDYVPSRYSVLRMEGKQRLYRLRKAILLINEHDVLVAQEVILLLEFLLLEVIVLEPIK